MQTLHLCPPSPRGQRGKRQEGRHSPWRGGRCGVSEDGAQVTVWTICVSQTQSGGPPKQAGLPIMAAGPGSPGHTNPRPIQPCQYIPRRGVPPPRAMPSQHHHLSTHIQPCRVRAMFLFPRAMFYSRLRICSAPTPLPGHVPVPLASHLAALRHERHQQPPQVWTRPLQRKRNSF